MNSIFDNFLSIIYNTAMNPKIVIDTKEEGISINQFISTAVAEKMSALMTVDYLKERARHGRREDLGISHIE